jgi:Mrr N-terminal domain
MEEPLLRVLIKLGGSVDFSAKGRTLEVMLAQEFGLSDADRDFAAPNYHSEGTRKWRNHIQFVRDQLVKKRQLDNSVRGRWTVTDSGYRRVGMRRPSTQN